MKFLMASTVALTFLMAGCTTKVYNQPSPTGQPTVIEHEREVEQPQPPTPPVQNNVHVDENR